VSLASHILTFQRTRIPQNEDPNLTIQHHIPEDLNPQQCYCENIYLTNFRPTAKLAVNSTKQLTLIFLLSLMLFHYIQQLYFPHLTEIFSGICATDRERET
jgi:hypothetical protein